MLFGWGPCQNHRKKYVKSMIETGNRNQLKYKGLLLVQMCAMTGDIIHKINRMINTWSKGKLTLPGKITLIKSLV